MSAPTSQLPVDKIQLFSGANATATSSAFAIQGGYYAWHIEGTMGSGTTVQLQYLGDDGVTYQNFGSARTTNDANNTPANSSTMLIIGGPAIIQAVIAVANPTGLYVSLNRIP